jgi:hypothetical protein
MTFVEGECLVAAHIVMGRACSSEPSSWFNYIGTFSSEDDARRAGEASQGEYRVWSIVGRQAEEIHREWMSVIVRGAEGEAADVSEDIHGVVNEIFRDWISDERNGELIDGQTSPEPTGDDTPAPTGGIDDEIINTIRMIYGGFADLDKEKKKDGPNFDWSG